jgi:hypothetical protein
MCKSRRFCCFVAAALMASLIPACSSPQPTSTDTFKPLLAVKAQKAKIAVYSGWPKGTSDEIVAQINHAIDAAGQDVLFEIQYIPYQDGKYADEVFFDQVKTELAAGNPSADAYLFNYIKSQKLFDAGLTMDVTTLLLQNATGFCSKYGNMFPEKLTGIPTCISNQPMLEKTALMLRDDFASAGSGVSTVEDLFGFIDETIVKPEKKYVVRAYENDLIAQWALEKGYYPLDNYNMRGFLYFSIGDPSFTPVPLEKIPGFAGFITEMNRLRKAGALQEPFDTNDERDCIAFVYPLSYYYYSSPYTNIPIAKGHFTAQPFSPDMPGFCSSGSGYNCELAIPAACEKEKAAEVARFAEWLYTSQDNYDSVVYGVKGVDFVDEAGKYTPLIGGKPLSGEGFEQIDGLFFAWPGATDLSNSDFYRMPSVVPDRVEELMAYGLSQNQRNPLSERMPMDRNMIDKILDISDDMQAVAQQREDILYEMIGGDPAAFSESSLAYSMESLGKLKNKWLCEEYAALIQRLINSAK